MSTISSTSTLNAGATTTPAPTASQTLNQADFLQLLVTQMTSQDPLNPESDTDFAAQLAQFSSLQESTTMAGEMQGMQANNLVGRTVTATSSTSSAQTTGVVTGVDISSGASEVLINGQDFALSQITNIVPTSATTGASSN